MAGNTRCYRVTAVDGKLQREVVERSPKYADTVSEAIAKLTSEPPEPAFVRFHDIGAVETQYR